MLRHIILFFVICGTINIYAMDNEHSLALVRQWQVHRFVQGPTLEQLMHRKLADMGLLPIKEANKEDHKVSTEQKRKYDAVEMNGALEVPEWAFKATRGNATKYHKNTPKYSRRRGSKTHAVLVEILICHYCGDFQCDSREALIEHILRCPQYK